MADDTKHGTPIPPGQNRPGQGSPIECADFEALLSLVLDDDVLNGDRAPHTDPPLNASSKASFEAHRRVCGVCGPMFAEVQAGRLYLQSLEPVEPPVHLVHNILAATSGVLSTRPALATRDGRTTPFAERMRERWDSWFAPVAAFVRQPRFAMSFGMIFFSFSLALNAAGVKATDLAKIDLRPSAVRHAYIDAQIKVVKYYDNVRFVYDIESKLRELKRSSAPPDAPTEQKGKPNNNTSGQPDQRQDRNYSQDYDQPVLAALRNGTPIANLRDGVDVSPAVTATINRRFL